MKSLRRTMVHDMAFVSLTERRKLLLCASAGCSDSFHGQRGPGGSPPRFFVSSFASIAN